MHTKRKNTANGQRNSNKVSYNNKNNITNITTIAEERKQEILKQQRNKKTIFVKEILQSHWLTDKEQRKKKTFGGLKNH